MQRSGHRPHILALVVAAGMSLAACAGPGGPTAASSSPSVPPTKTVTAPLTDFAITLSSDEFTAGPYEFVLKDQGTHPHALAIMGPGLENTMSGILKPGTGETFPVTLKEGTYHLWCPVGKHADKGMSTMIRVE